MLYAVHLHCIDLVRMCSNIRPLLKVCAWDLHIIIPEALSMMSYLLWKSVTFLSLVWAVGGELMLINSTSGISIRYSFFFYST